MRRNRALLVCAVLTVAGSSPAAAGGSSLAVPLSVPPSMRPDAGASSWDLEAGWASVRGPGVSLSGPGGGWGLDSASPGVWGAELHAEAFALSGDAEPAGAGTRRTTGMAGSLEADAVLAPGGASGPWRFHAGGLVGMSILDFADTRSLPGLSGTVVEPSSAYSVLVGFPVGADYGGRLARDWTASAGTRLTVVGGGATFYGYFLRGTHAYSGSTKVDPLAMLGAHARVEYAPWRLSFQAGAEASSRSGNSRGLTGVWLLAAWRGR